MNNQKIVVANFKMNLVLKFEMESWLRGFLRYKTELNNLSDTRIVLCPAGLQTSIFINEIKDIKLTEIGLQDCFWERKGSYTGGISAVMGKSLGSKYVILGHSERKKYFGETEEIVALKLKNSASVGLKSILCIGESVEEKRADLTNKSLNRQLDIYLKDFPQGQLDRLLIAYEPVWAISSNKPVNPPTVDEIMMAKLMIRKNLVNKYGAKLAEKINILYGGSVGQRNVEEICFEAGMDGVLVGKASLVPAELMGIVKKLEKRN
jgi:triosephosphate isomerase